jgi:hypothetical protein
MKKTECFRKLAGRELMKTRENDFAGDNCIFMFLKYTLYFNYTFIYK